MAQYQDKMKSRRMLFYQYQIQWGQIVYFTEVGKFVNIVQVCEGVQTFTTDMALKKQKQIKLPYVSFEKIK